MSRLKRLRVIKDDASISGYSIDYGGDYVPATPSIIKIWHMYLEALDLAQRLRGELEDLSIIQINHAAEGRSIEGENHDK